MFDKITPREFDHTVGGICKTVIDISFGIPKMQHLECGCPNVIAIFVISEFSDILTWNAVYGDIIIREYYIDFSGRDLRIDVKHIVNHTVPGAII